MAFNIISWALSWGYEKGDWNEGWKEKGNMLTKKEITAKKRQAFGCQLGWIPLNELIQEFVGYVESGMNFYCELNWKKIYSIEVIKVSQERWCDLENAFYLLFCWKTKIEREKIAEEKRRQRELEKKRKKLEAIEKIPWWIEKGKEYIDESKWSDWKGFVEKGARWMYYWEEVELVLKILKMIDSWDSRKKIQKVLDKKWGEGYYYSIVRNRVIKYSKKWIDARDNLHEPY